MWNPHLRRLSTSRRPLFSPPLIFFTTQALIAASVFRKSSLCYCGELFWYSTTSDREEAKLLRIQLPNERYKAGKIKQVIFWHSGWQRSSRTTKQSMVDGRHWRLVSDGRAIWKLSGTFEKRMETTAWWGEWLTPTGTEPMDTWVDGIVTVNRSYIASDKLHITQ